jgi:hypothetical protein
MMPLRFVPPWLLTMLFFWGLSCSVAWAQSTLINGSRTITGAFNYCAEASNDDANVNTYRCPLSPPITGYRAGTRYTVKVFTTNTGAASINLNALGAVPIKKMAGAITTDVAANDIRAGQIVDVIYDGLNMQMISQLGNAGDFSSNTATSVVNEIMLFADTGGKTGKRATGSGLATLASGVLGTVAAPAGAVTGTIASGTIALATAAIASGVCATEQTATATGTLTTDTVLVSFNQDVSGVTGYTPSTAGTLRIDSYPKAGQLGVRVCNATANPITPGAITLNFRVVR